MAFSIKRCHICESNKISHEYQDAVYGKYIRVFNQGTKAEKCTVCNNGTPKRK